MVAVIDRHTHEVVGWCMSLIADDGLNVERSIATNHQIARFRYFLLTLSIDGYSNDGVSTLFRRCENSLIGRLSVGAYQHVVGIKPHLADGAGLRCGNGRDRDRVADTIDTVK